MSTTPTDGEREAACRAVLELAREGYSANQAGVLVPAALEAAYTHPDGTVARLTRERDEALRALRAILTQVEAPSSKVRGQLVAIGRIATDALAQKDTP